MEHENKIPAGLNLVSGLSNEKVAERLTNARIRYAIRWEEPEEEGYFRSSRFIIDLRDIPDVECNVVTSDERLKRKFAFSDVMYDLLGFPDHFRDYDYSYFAKYQIVEGFNFSVLHGRVKFDRGRLIERTRVVIGQV